MARNSAICLAYSSSLCPVQRQTTNPFFNEANLILQPETSISKPTRHSYYFKYNKTFNIYKIRHFLELSQKMLY